MSTEQRFRELIAVNRAIVSSLDYDEVLRLVVEKACALVGSDICLLLLAGPDDLVRIVASRGLPSEVAERFSARFDEGIRESLRRLLGFQRDDFFLGVPIVDHGLIRGILAVYRRGSSIIEPEDEELITALADQAAIALEHAARYRDARRIGAQYAGRLSAIYTNTGYGLAFLDRDLRFVEVNAAYAQKFGLPVEQMVGRLHAELAPARNQTRSLLRGVLASGEPLELREMEHERRGEMTYWDWTAHPVLDELGRVEGLVISAIDVTAKVRAREEIELANRRKDEFLAMLAHELRNPLAAISSAVELMRMPAQANAERVHAAASRQVTHMTRLLDDLLDVSRITTGKIQLRRQTVDLCSIVTRALQLVGSAMQAKRHRLAVNMDGTAIQVDGDPDRLLQVICNLLVNAVKYTEDGGEISIDVQLVAGRARLAVRDNGIGIAPETLPHLFELFMQADRALDRSQGGLGIGLTIVKRLIEMHGGEIHVHSKGLGLGSEFVAWLPALESSVPAAPEPAAPARVTAPVRRILLVEDNEDAAALLAEMLELDGHRVTVVGDGESAIDAAQREMPDVVLLDIGLPRMSGYDVARYLRENVASDPPLLIALTGYGQDHDVRASREAGIHHHMVKPVEPDLLRGLLASAGPGPVQSGD